MKDLAKWKAEEERREKSEASSEIQGITSFSKLGQSHHWRNQML